MIGVQGARTLSNALLLQDVVFNGVYFEIAEERRFDNEPQNNV